MDYFSVSALNSYIKNRLESDEELKNIQVLGEISNFKAHSSGHLYFTLKDEQSRISAVMFSSYVKRVSIRIENGLKVVVSGSVSVYKAGGSYQIYVYALEPIGIGNLYLQFEELKKRLAEEGLFAAEHKKDLPPFPKSIGVISAKEGAAIRDVITTIKRRWPLTKITLLPSLVQGKSATSSIVKALEKADSLNFDVLIIARGGGSLEDLWCFNEEEVARTVYALKTPIIAAIGHETDTTIIDFVADKRAATPTAAAELATPNLENVLRLLEQQNLRLIKAFTNRLDNQKKNFKRLASCACFNQKELLYAHKALTLHLLEQQLLNVKERLFNQAQSLLNTCHQELRHSIMTKVEKSKHKLGLLISKINSLNPLEILNRGYGMLEVDNKIIKSVKQVEIGQQLDISLHDGKIQANITNKEEIKHG